MIVMGIDISQSSTGIAILKADKKIEVVKTFLLQNPSEQLQGEYYKRIRQTVSHFIETHGPEAVVAEDLNIRFLNVAKKIMQIHGVVKEAVYSKLEQEVICYNVSVWRFTILGLKRYTAEEKKKVNALDTTKKEKKQLLDVKNKVIEFVNTKLETNFTYEQNDISDACGLGLAYLKEKGHKL